MLSAAENSRWSSPCAAAAYLHIPVAGFDERHTFTFTLDDDAGGNRLHTAGRQLRHHLLPEHRADLVAVKAVEDAALLRIDHLAVELARRLHGKLDGVLGDLVEHHPLDGHFGAGLSTSIRCQAIASPSRSSSVAR